MASKQQVEQMMTELETLQLITQAFGEIASSRMKQTRDFVITSRDYINGITDVFDDIRRGYVLEIGKLVKRQRSGKRKESVTMLSHNGRSVVVLLSANTGLYGEILRKTFNAFLEEVHKGGSEVTIIGKQGLQTFQTLEPNIAYTYFDLPDHAYTSDQIAKIIRHIVRYDEIHLYFGRFQNVLVQNPERAVLNSDVDLEQKPGGEKPKRFLFEPDLVKLLAFFEIEMFGSLFEQVVRESQLAKFASRILAMDKASENIKEERKRLNLERLGSMHREMNKKQLNSLTGVLAVIG
ncbi:MAG: F0F1 ATP synthase subunit gamma [Candidatus Woesebacteria bacterium]